MTQSEAKAAFLAGEPITYGGITYLHISGLIYRLQDGKTVLKLELVDKCLHSVTIADPERVALMGKGGAGGKADQAGTQKPRLLDRKAG